MISWQIVWQTLKGYWVTILLYCVGLTGYSMFLVSFYPIAKEVGSSYTDIIEKMPEQLRQAFGAADFFQGGLTFEAFLSLEHLNFFWVIAVSAFVIGFASRAIAGEIEQGTIALLLAKPINRTQIFLSKLMVGILGILAIVGTAMGGILWQAGRSDIEVAPVEGYWLFMGVAVLFFATILSITMLFSAWVNERGRAILFGMLFVIGSYVLDVFVRLKPEWDEMGWLSLFKYYGKPDEVLSLATFDDLHLIVFVALILLTTGWGIVSFNRRDISV